MNDLIPNFFPTHSQALLLKTALLDGDKCIAAWEEFSASWKHEDYLDNSCFRLLPLVYRKLENLHYPDPRISLLKGIYKQAWVKNQQLFNGCQSVLQLFHEIGIETILLKGSAFTILYYKDGGTRPMSDIDVLIPERKSRLAIDILHEHGWKAENEDYLEYNLRYGKSMMFYDTEGYQFDLHWCPFFESHSEVVRHDFWDKATPVLFLKTKTLAFCAEDNLLHTIIHGMRCNPEPPVRWIADAMVLLSTVSDFEWDRFSAACQDLQGNTSGSGCYSSIGKGLWFGGS